MDSCKYKFSFVIPVYNVEDYLSETIESVLAQSMNFVENCEIILINDGSTDGSEKICFKYKEKFPNNIVYLSHKNRGLSATRNRGIKYVRGKYVSFLDSDDKISRHTLRDVYAFFEENYDKVDFVSIRQTLFEATVGPHPLDYKFTNSRIVDIEKDYDMPQLSACSSFVKAEVFTHHLFDAKIRKFAEDVKFLTELVFDKGAYGIVVGPRYYYRKRGADTSIINSSQKDPYWYLGTPKDVYKYLFDLSKERFGRVIPYVQYIVMYDLQWRVIQDTTQALTNEQIQQYKASIYSLVDDIDSGIILSQKNLPVYYKNFLLTQKNTKPNKHKKEIIEIAAKDPVVVIEFIQYKDSNLIIEGFVQGYNDRSTTVSVSLAGATITAKVTTRIHNTKTFLGDVVQEGIGFIATVPLRPGKLEITIDYGDKPRPAQITTRRFSQLDDKTGAYRLAGDHLLQKRSYGILVKSRTNLQHVGHELVFIGRRLLSVRLRDALARFSRVWRFGWGAYTPRKAIVELIISPLIPIKETLLTMRTVVFRSLYYIIKPTIKSNIWIISDRVNAASDNGEALFRYISSLEDTKGVRAYYAIKKSSSDYTRIQQYGRVLDRDSLRYKLMFLLADKIVSSHADDFIINAFTYRINDFIDICNFDFVFLQHGITKDDISRWLNRYSKNIKLFVAAAKPEYESLLEQNYGYSPNEVKLTGFPRYDLRENHPANKLVITPTWRHGIVVEADQKTGLRPYNPRFVESEYYQFYQRLINDDRLIKALRDHGMTAEFYPHPNLAPQIKDFLPGESIRIVDIPYDYTIAFSQGDIMLTDFSSVAFDFAYLRKPVVYAQFDRKTFFQGHLYDQGYFSYEDDGFGPVLYNYEDTIAALIALIDAREPLNQKYGKRIDKFFNFSDKNNSQRVFDAIVAMDKKV
ncbi:MAG TPA: CDP-glycerol glycerophosphotransferase family protein [Candidatus Saccharibacteria bacterium]|nr:CDP-glycerol glycerophosphotransferase family protein [Candidatus Saccharibacteria bacterium]